MISAELPPSSSKTRLRPECAFSSHPTLADPVKVTSLMRSSFSASHAVSAFDKGRTASASCGHPAFRITSPSASAVNGVCGAGLRRMGQPAAIAGATLCATRFSGKLKRRDGQDGADGKALHQSPAAFVAFREIQRNGLAAQARNLFGSGLEGEHGAIDLSARQANRLARFGHDQLARSVPSAR